MIVVGGFRSVCLKKDKRARALTQKQPKALQNLDLQNRFAALVEEGLNNHAQTYNEDVDARQAVLKEVFENFHSKYSKNWD